MINIQENEVDSVFIKRRKAAVQKKYKPTNSRSLEEANQLAVYLYSVGLQDDTEELLGSYCENSPFEKGRYERWDAACFAMLFNAHLKKLKGEKEEYERLMSIVINEVFNPFNWFNERKFDEFLQSVTTPLEAFGECTKHEKCQGAAEGFLALLYAKHVWSLKWKSLVEREQEINKIIQEQLERIRNLVS